MDRRFYALINDHIGTPTALLDPETGTLSGWAQASMWSQTVWTGEGGIRVSITVPRPACTTNHHHIFLDHRGESTDVIVDRALSYRSIDL